MSEPATMFIRDLGDRFQEPVTFIRSQLARWWPSGRSTASGQPDIPDQVRKLAELRGSGSSPATSSSSNKAELLRRL